MKKIVLLIVLVVLLFGCNGQTGGVNNQNTGNAPAVEVKEISETKASNGFYFISSSDYYHVTGVVENTGNTSLKHVRAEVTVTTSTGEKKVYDDVIVHPARLAPGEKGGFNQTLGPSDEFRLEEFEVKAGSFMVDESKPFTDFEIKNEEVNDTGSYYKLGATVQNNGTEQAPSYWINALFFDSQGHVLAIGDDVVLKDGDGLKPKDEKPVSFIVVHPNENNRITNYKIAIDYSE